MRRLEDKGVLAICAALVVWGAFLLSFPGVVQYMGGICVLVGAYVMGKRVERATR